MTIEAFDIDGIAKKTLNKNDRVSFTMIYKIKKGKCWKDVTCLLTK